MTFLGLNSFFEHPAAALIRDGELVFAAEDERFTGIKHGRRYTPFKSYMPLDAIYHALSFAGLTTADLAGVGYSYSSALHLKSLGGCLTGQRISSLREELEAFRSCRNNRLVLTSGYELLEKHRRVIDPADFGRARYQEWDHHLCHAASAFFGSGFERALVIVADGSGEASSTSVYLGSGRTLEPVDRYPIPHSLGIFYSMVTRHLGFEPFSDEFKVMGLAAYGEPRFVGELEQVLVLGSDGGYRVALDRLQALERLLGERRRPWEPLLDVHRDIARSAQVLLERAIEGLVRRHVRQTGADRLCLAGGVFLNCVSNGRLAEKGLVSDIFVHPAAHDAGTAVGAATLSWIAAGGDGRLRFDSMALGTRASPAEVTAVLDRGGIPYTRLGEDDMTARLAGLLARGAIGALFRGRMEFGPRALGMRSLVASPVLAETRTRLNDIKQREQFRPISPMVTEEAFSDFFDGFRSRYMLFTVKVRPGVAHRIAAVAHVDGTARAQVIRRADDPFLHQLLTRFGERSGVPILVNTSFNVRGKPIVENVSEALGCFYASGLDFLLLDDVLVERAPDGSRR
ncbi:MAG TPA: carbamoyltransferase C-terminal domain-containing protein [Kofleriaceae bacterium]|nr:carbamoyltransferase C-terminal domain-containing protein [Kofleriaceae bacterium]